MLKEYYLYLDESGDFDKDLTSSWKNECLVGGFLIEKDKKDTTFPWYNVRKMLIDSYVDICGNPSNLTDDQIMDIMKHATELKDKKAELSCEVLKRSIKHVEFVIFENYLKTSVIDSSTTYINILVDGIIQLLTRLVINNNNDTVKLHLVIGKRLDTTKKKESGDTLYNYIDIAEYERRIKEKISLERLKNHSLQASRSDVDSIILQNDKIDLYLVLCDYICNFYITRTAQVFQEKRNNDQSFQEYMMGFYKDKYLFRLSGGAEEERVMHYKEQQSYDAALFDICTGIMERKSNIDTIIQAIKALNEKQIHNVLNGFMTYTNNMIDVERNTTTSLDYLEKATEILDQLSADNINVERYYTDISLYKLAVYDHRGDLAQMGNLFDSCQKHLKSMLVHMENIDYAFIYYNRYAVYLYDILEFHKGYELLDNLEKSFDAYEILISELPGAEFEPEQIKSLQLGKILGTKAQYARQLLKQKEISYEEAVEISEKAISNFILEADKKRQYQYRAQIEATVGNVNAAMAYYNKGLGLEKWNDIFREENINEFGLYHLSFMADYLSHKDEKLVKNILKLFKANEKYLFSRNAFPGFVTCYHLMRAMRALNMDTKLVEKYFKRSIAYLDDESCTPLFQLFIILIYTDYIGYLIKNNLEANKMYSEVLRLIEELSAKDLPESLQTMLGHITVTLQSMDSAEIQEISRILPY